MPPAKKKKGRKKKTRKIRIAVDKLIFDLFLCFLAFTLIPVLVFRAVNPPTTPLMWIRWAESGYREDFPRTFNPWVPLERISPHLQRAVLAAEDQKFYIHNGFDWKAIENAVKTNLATQRTRGASTISMQTARNVFLWQDRNWLRKALEAYFTFLIEALWPKERILEVYLNVIEWGDGIFGCHAAARTYFNHSPEILSPVESASMAAILPNPRVWSVANPGKYVVERKAKILDLMNRIQFPGMD